MTRKTLVMGTCLVTALLVLPAAALAQTAPSLGNAQPLVVLGGSGVTNTGSSVLNGDLGSYPNGAITGFPPGIVAGGVIDNAGTRSELAQQAVTTAANALTAQACQTNFAVPTDIGNSTRLKGVYCFASSAAITGPLTLDAGGNADAVFIFITGSTLITASSSSVVLINGAQACNVFWRVGSSATLGTSTTFVGNILAQTSITLNTGATVQGRALAQTGAVTLDTNTLTKSTCASTSTTPGTGGSSCPVITIAPTSLPTSVVGVAYSQAFTAGNGTAPDTTFTFDVLSGALPPGLTLSAAGLLAGTPHASSVNGIYLFTIRAAAPNACFGTAAFTTFVANAVPTLPQVFGVMLALGLCGIGYIQLRRRVAVRVRE
jgi:hypothetical protein